ncbi:hypothetical protein [Puia sp.]|uniref:type IV toxin-antitoxin system AbiEi family antitoxin domain-containing protein n=1 Tax=Puia sp. TaxID=2045100 RepID=UPI002D7F2A7A|nr:hypothetical protein [Puia sp.]
MTHQVLLSLLKGYKRPNEKVHDLRRKGILSPVRKGLYVAGPALGGGRPEPFLLANHILGPSYVSLDSALSYYGLIPERVFETTSMTTKTSRTFHTPLGTFSYTSLPLPYYAFGIRRIGLSEDQYALIAVPEKALADKVISTSGLIIRSRKAASEWLLENLRMDETQLRELNTRIMGEWLKDAPKKTSLQMLINAIQGL